MAEEGSEIADIVTAVLVTPYTIRYFLPSEPAVALNVLVPVLTVTVVLLATKVAVIPASVE
jgi:hypothetical protein